MKEKVLKALEKLGFLLEPVGDIGYCFNYEGGNYLWLYNDNDTDYFVLAYAGVVEKDDISSEAYYSLIDHLNSEVKYVKAYTFCDSISLFYEREIVGEEDFEETIPRMIFRLAHTAAMIQDILKGETDESAGDEIDDDEDDTDESEPFIDDTDDDDVEDVDYCIVDDEDEKEMTDED